MGWLEAGLDIQLDNVVGYAQVVEDALAAKLGEFRAEGEAAVAKMSDEEKADYYDFYSGDFWQLADVFPNTLRYSLLMTCYSVFEHHLVTICNYLHRYHPASEAPELEKSAIGGAGKYLKTTRNVSFPQLDRWDDIQGYNLARNAVVHQGGVVAKSRYPGALASFVKWMSEVEISEDG